MVNEIKMHNIRNHDGTLWLQLNWMFRFYPHIAELILRTHKIGKKTAINLIKSQSYFK